MSSDLKRYVAEHIVADTVRVLRGKDTMVLDYHVASGTTATSGFTSRILRVTATIQQPATKQDSAASSDTLTFIVKTQSEDKFQRNLTSQWKLFEREIGYFCVAVPLLQQSCPSALPIVRCLLARPNLIVLEDLTASGYGLLAADMAQVGSIIIDVSCAELIVEKIALLHAASADKDWLHLWPLLRQDIVLGDPNSALVKLVLKSCSAYADLLDHCHKDADKKYSQWLRNQEATFSVIRQLVSPCSSGDAVNVLAHGDFWLNNMMMKRDPVSGHIQDMKLIDFQLCRFMPPSRDVMYFMYVCVNAKFRRQHESDLLCAYVHHFNKALGTDRLKMDAFVREYDSTRLYGLIFAMCFRTIDIMLGLPPIPGEETTVSIDDFESLFSGECLKQLVKYYEQPGNVEIIHCVDTTIQEFIKVFDMLKL